ncbi:MAG: hypothetical protein S0880_05555 [Actinomycetota bacterium]|nr:hypothetical protein [Actinomycetota bacterium]
MAHDHDELLRLYLDDHWAGAGAGASLAKRLQQNNRDTPWAGELTWLARQVEEDDERLESLRRDIDAEGGTLKRYAARVGERIGRLVPNRRLRSYSPLSRVLETEAMMAGVAGKARLWTSLCAGGAGRTRLAPFDLERLGERAEEQLAVLHEFHERAAAVAFDPAVETLQAPSTSTPRT